MSAASIGRQLVAQVLEPLRRAFVCKDEVVDLMGVSLVAGENLFLLGPPGTAKSALVRDLARRLDGRSFEYLLTRFTEPSELFGPFDIRRLREGELVTNTEGMLPEASLVFLDELWNANSAILNSLLTVLNERLFLRGREKRRLPTLMVVGASNSLPEEEALEALYDRFLLRVRCENVPAEHTAELLAAGWELEHAERDGAGALSIEQVRALHGQLCAVDLQPVREPYLALIGNLRGAGVPISDRRAVKLQRPIAASALLCGRGAAAVSDLWVLRHIWETPEQEALIAGIVQQTLAGANEEEREAAHPRARDGERPDPEALAAELERIEDELAGAQKDGPAWCRLRDRLSRAAGRCLWVADPARQQVLQEWIDRLWAHFER